MRKEEISTIINAMRVIQWEDDLTIREVLSSACTKNEITSAFRECNNPVSEDITVVDVPANVIDGYFK